MKLTYENCDRLKLTKDGNFICGKWDVYIFKDKCKTCGEPFLSRNKYRNGECTNTDYCCNGCARKNKTASLETRKKMSIAHSGENNPNFGRKFSAEIRQRMSKGNMGKKLSAETKIKLSKGHGVTRLGIPLYNTYGHQLTIFEEVRIHMVLVDGVVYKSLQVRCNESRCRKWFKPTLVQIQRRMQAYNGTICGQCNLYCSEECKVRCSTFNQKIWPKLQNPNKQAKPYSGTEYKLYRKVVLERENYICEYCEAKATCVHHEQTQKEQPMLSLDPDYGHACCKKCHMRYGHKKGTECSTNALSRKIC